MSRPQDGRDMDRPSAAGGSVKRARELAQARGAAGRFMTPEASPPQVPPPRRQQQQQQQQGLGGLNAGQSRLPRPMQPGGGGPGGGGNGGGSSAQGLAISRPTPVPQWPLAGPISVSEGQEPYQPPPGRSQPPQRPPRPSRVPSILDGSRVQDPAPAFQYSSVGSRDSDEYGSSVPPTPSTQRQTVSSVGSIPDFPAPAPPAMPPPRRSVNLGPPPSSRRGASSFYSNASFVSPIPEESPRSRSHTSFASSAAMPESWGTPSPGMSPNYQDIYFEDPIREEGRESMYDEYGDESKLVRSASIGKRGKPALVMNRTPGGNDQGARPSPSPIQPPFESGTGYVEASTSSSTTLPTKKQPSPEPPPPPPPPPTAETMLGAYAAASAMDPTDPRRPSPSPRPYNRLSAIRRPPKLDMESVARMEERGSMTSLPDLIRRATRLAAMIDRGKRPASRFEDFDYPDEKAGGDRELSMDDRHQSGFSDMLAAFPPPAQARQSSRPSRTSWFRSSSSWPLPQERGDTPPDAPPLPSNTRSPGTPDSELSRRRGRRCCGLPLWAFIIIIIVILGIVAAAVVLPLEFFVFRSLQGGNQTPEPALVQCQQDLTCSNGGTNVVSQGVCSCICTNGFTGSNCTVGGAAGCTTTTLVANDGGSDIEDVTLGQAIPRLIAQAGTNFSVPLSGTAILARFNDASLSCIAQNSLVTFNDQSTRAGEADAVVFADGGAFFVNNAFLSLQQSVVTVPEGETMTLTFSIPPPDATAAASFSVTTIFATTFTFTLPVPTTTPPTTTTTTTTTLSSTSTPPPPPTETFVVTEEVLDFARVAVLLVLQTDSVQAGSEAQVNLQKFFGDAIDTPRGTSFGEAGSIDLGGGNSVDLVNFKITTRDGTVGGRNAVRMMRMRRDGAMGVRRGGALLPRVGRG